jgi:hypothetical protein
MRRISLVLCAVIITLVNVALPVSAQDDTVGFRCAGPYSGTP